MPYKSEVDFNLYVKAIVDHFDLKVLVVRGWGLKGKEIYKNDQVLAIDAAPFTALFPLVDFVVHHGGAGTTAIALKSGLPQMICPVLHPFGDQYFWGKQIERNGVGVSPIPLKKLTVNKFIDSIRQLVDERLSIEADKLKQKLAAENGLLRAKEIIEKHYAQQQRSRSL
ncbi:MAG: nucleotide disphospho-sugar-binding domain-containing protein [Thermonemataceae bacterium]